MIPSSEAPGDTSTPMKRSSCLLILGKKIPKSSVLNRVLQRTPLQTLLYFRISRTRLVKASSTLIRCLADVSINLQPKCLARSRPSTNRKKNPSQISFTSLIFVLEPYHSCQLDVHIPNHICSRRQ